jgi:uridine kinase
VRSLPLSQHTQAGRHQQAGRHTHAADLTRRLSAAVTGLSRLHQRVLVGIDGPDCAGKTTLADRLADAPRVTTPHTPTTEVTTLQASVDGFNRPRAQRYLRGELSPEGYYLDGFDYPALLDQCLLPFLNGEARIRTTAFDHRSDARENAEATAVAARAVLIVDGVFLLRPELRELWTVSVYLRVSPAETLRRAHGRDLELFGSCEEIERRYLGRYLPGQALYRERADPERLAHILVDNERPGAPRIKRWNVMGLRSLA